MKTYGGNVKRNEWRWQTAPRFVAFPILLVIILIVCGSLYAHHGSAAYDRTITLSLKGTITDFSFANPHIQISFDAPDENGKIIHWVAEGGSPAGLVRRGWSRNTLKVGDQVTIEGNPAKGLEGKDTRIMALTKLTLANGQVIGTEPNNQEPGTRPSN